MNNLDRMKQALAREDYPQALEAEALRLIEEDKQLCDRIAEAGSAGEARQPTADPLQHRRPGDRRGRDRAGCCAGASAGKWPTSG
jgi:hypothetical protein